MMETIIKIAMKSAVKKPLSEADYLIDAGVYRPKDCTATKRLVQKIKNARLQIDAHTLVYHLSKYLEGYFDADQFLDKDVHKKDTEEYDIDGTCNVKLFFFEEGSDGSGEWKKEFYKYK